ncbi:location of vulva defective 1-like [Mizuhopecten yessoensis]|uniref:location of vulva defective 1-like n=1 Tax=Mizuhopecten yessoensis TaxID=6573 RepID=UPI000B4573F6|nr:location of vulva defective 1-like [Mizuhopecten yessoensis]
MSNIPNAPAKVELTVTFYERGNTSEITAPIETMVIGTDYTRNSSTVVLVPIPSITRPTKIDVWRDGIDSTLWKLLKLTMESSSYTFTFECDCLIGTDSAKSTIFPTEDMWQIETETSVKTYAGSRSDFSLTVWDSTGISQTTMFYKSFKKGETTTIDNLSLHLNSPVKYSLQMVGNKDGTKPDCFTSTTSTTTTSTTTTTVPTTTTITVPTTTTTTNIPTTITTTESSASTEIQSTREMNTTKEAVDWKISVTTGYMLNTSFTKADFTVTFYERGNTSESDAPNVTMTITITQFSASHAVVNVTIPAITRPKMIDVWQNSTESFLWKMVKLTMESASYNFTFECDCWIGNSHNKTTIAAKEDMWAIQTTTGKISFRAANATFSITVWDSTAPDCPITTTSTTNAVTTTPTAPPFETLSTTTEIFRNVTSDVSNNASIRKKTSATDSRDSSKAIGFFGAALLAIPFVFIMVLDLSRFFQFLQSL